MYSSPQAKTLLVLTVLSWLGASNLVAQEATPPESAAKKSSYKATTTDNPEIAIDQLKTLVKPLTKSELETEASAWMDLLHAKAKEIAAAQFKVKETKEVIDAQKERVDEEEASQPSTELQNADEPSSDAANATEEVAEAEEAKKESLLTEMNALYDQRTALVDRLEVVLDSLELKGGDGEEIRKYISAVSGLEIDTKDASATWAAISGWIVSKEGGQRWAWNFAKFFLILFISWIVSKIIAAVVNWLLERRVRLTQLAERLVSSSIKNVVLLVGFAIALTSLEIDITPILAAIGATGFIIGFALQGTLSNFASGLMILINRPFDVGDVVTAGGVTGSVKEMNLVSTTFLTFDNQTIHVPNNEIWGTVITNITANDKRRVDMQFGIGYDDDFLEAEKIIMDIVTNHELVLEDPEPVVITHELGDSCVNIVCRPWAKTSDYWTVKTEVTRLVKQRFDAAHISIPYPQRDVHVYQHVGSPQESK